MNIEMLNVEIRQKIGDAHALNQAMTKAIIGEDVHTVAQLIVALVKTQANWNKELHLNASAGNLDGVKKALEQGADVKFANNLPLRNACFNGHLKVAKYLIEKRAKINNELISEVIERGNVEILKLLVEHGADITSGYKKALKFLRLACDNRHYEMTRFLLEKGSKIHDYTNSYLLQQACSRGYTDIARLLVEFGADINTRYQKALQEAIYMGHLDVVVCLVENGADFRSDNDWALRFATRWYRTPIRDYLVSQGADPQKVVEEEHMPEEQKEWAIAFVKSRDLANKLSNELQNKVDEKPVAKRIKI